MFVDKQFWDVEIRASSDTCEVKSKMYGLMWVTQVQEDGGKHPEQPAQQFTRTFCSSASFVEVGSTFACVAAEYKLAQCHKTWFENTSAQSEFHEVSFLQACL